MNRFPAILLAGTFTRTSCRPSKFALELRLVQNCELTRPAEIPAEVTADVTPRRLQQFRVQANQTARWKIEQAGRLLASGTATADDQALLTVPRVKVTAEPIVLSLSK